VEPAAIAAPRLASSLQVNVQRRLGAEPGADSAHPAADLAGGATTSGAGKWLSHFTVTHWSSFAMKVTARIPYTKTGGQFGTTELLTNWAALAIMATVFVAFASWRLARQRA
jgi:hypothetical protein